jgi:hypothetical protein
MAKEWKAGDYIPVQYINALEKEAEELRKFAPGDGDEDVDKSEG